MTCPNCGSLMLQGSGGGWACGNCGTVRTTARPAEPVLSSCSTCAAEVVDGPAGGYSCGRCGHVEEPPARMRERRDRATTRR